MKTKTALFTLVSLIFTMVGCTGGTPGTLTPLLCVDFSTYADDTTFGNPFSLNSYQFTGLGGEPFVNFSGTVVGLQFTDTGLDIDVPGPVSSVTLDVASFTTTALTLSALDTSGAAVATATAPGDSTIHNIKLAGTDIVKVTITGGGSEGILVNICNS